jgi:hypothetical protein
VAGGFVGGVGLPAVPDHVEPGAGEDACGVGVIVSTGSGAVVKSGRPLKRARFPTTFTRLNCSVSKRNSSSCRSGCGLDPATSAQLVDLADLTVEGVGPVCDRRLTDAAKASSNS